MLKILTSVQLIWCDFVLHVATLFLKWWSYQWLFSLLQEAWVTRSMSIRRNGWPESWTPKFSESTWMWTSCSGSMKLAQGPGDVTHLDQDTCVIRNLRCVLPPIFSTDSATLGIRDVSKISRSLWTCKPREIWRKFSELNVIVWIEYVWTKVNLADDPSRASRGDPPIVLGQSLRFLIRYFHGCLSVH